MSCEEDTVTYGGKNFVTFDNVANTRLNFFEHLGVAEIPVNLAFPVSHDVTIAFDVETDPDLPAQPGVDYNLLTPGSVTIPAGQTSANIRVEVINNEIMNDSKYIRFRLKTVSDTNVSLGLTDEGSSYKRFLIVNDDCTTNFLEFYGKFNVRNAEGTLIGTAEADVNENGDCNVLLIKGTLQDAIGGLPTDGNIVFNFVPGANPSTGENEGTLTSFEQLYCAECFSTTEGNQTLLFVGGGRFSVANKRLTISGTLKTVSPLYPNIPTSVTLTPQ